MNTKQNHQQSNIEQARELLSPYLDDELSGEEKQFVEQQLHTSADLQADLESMRQTIFLLTALPKVAAPRPFTLSEADVGGLVASQKSQAGLFGLSGWLRGWVALAATLLLVAALGSALIFGPLGEQSAAEIALAPAQESDTAANESITMEAAEKAAPTEATEPPLAETLPQVPPPENQADLADQMPAQEAAEDAPEMAMIEEEAPAQDDEVGAMAAEVVEEAEAEEYGVPEQPDLMAAGVAEEESAEGGAAESALAPPSMARQATGSVADTESSAATMSVEENSAESLNESPTAQPLPTETPLPSPTDVQPTPSPTVQQPSLPVEWVVGGALLVLLGGLSLLAWLKIRRPS